MFTPAAGRMLTRTMRFILPRSVLTATLLNSVPDLAARLMLTLMTPFEPPGMVHGTGGSSAVVQPQDGRTERIVTGTGVKLVTATVLVRRTSIFVATLVKVKMNRAKACPLVASTVLDNASHTMTPSGNGSL